MYGARKDFKHNSLHLRFSRTGILTVAGRIFGLPDFKVPFFVAW